MSTTRFTNGLTTAAKGETLGEFIFPDFTKAHVFFEEFDYYNANDWNITTVGSPTTALADEDGGVLLVANSAADNDSDFHQKVGESFLMEAGKEAWFKARFKVSDATESAFVMGLQITDTTPLDVSDGIYVKSDDGDAFLDFVVVKDGIATEVTIPVALPDDTYVDVGAYYNGKDEIGYFINDQRLGTVPTTNLPDDEVLTISFGVENGEAVAKTMSVDYILAAKAR